MDTSTVAGVRTRRSARFHLAVSVDGEKGHLEVMEFFQKPGGIEHRMVLDGGDNEVPALFQIGQGGAFNGQVVGLGPTRGEDNAVGRGANEFGHPGPLFLDGIFNGGRQIINRRRVGEPLLKVREHGFDYFGPGRSGRGMVQICTLHRGVLKKPF
jgi:hypothetical protein